MLIATLLCKQAVSGSETSRGTGAAGAGLREEPAPAYDGRARRLLGERALVGPDVGLRDDSDEPVTLLGYEHAIELVLGH